MASRRLLDIYDHDRTFTAMRYVYPVVSRRAGGVSVGINLNTNNACNWHCVYCQVPGLVRGKAPPVDVHVLGAELHGFLKDALQGDFMVRHVPADARRISDIALSGNGEPSSAAEFAEVIDLAAASLQQYGLAQSALVRVITNGSLVDQPQARAGFERLGVCRGEAWFKLDGGRRSDIQQVNGVDLDPQAIARRLALCASLCSTWVQTCALRFDGLSLLQDGLDDYLRILDAAGMERLRGVLLYGPARKSMQPEASRVSCLADDELQAIAERLREKGLTVHVSP
ncbi:MAG: radical SAM protein [Rhodocyclaceae bacterium]|nr:radical SAM protein [Rhodocyclaceae bacterium]MBX3669195.1 radical SAM protein [Rhodocyclaceae bacterium]